MSYDFPANPTQDDEYTPPVGGQTYIYKAPRWLVKGIPPTGGEGGGGGIDEAPLDGKQYARFNATWSEVIIPAGTWDSITGKPATFPPTVPIAWTDVSGKPTTFPPTVPIAWTDVSGKPATYPPTVPIAWTDVSGKPSTYPPTLPIDQSGVTNLTSDLGLKAPLASPVLTGNPTAPTPTAGDNDTSIATTAFVTTAVSGKLDTATAASTYAPIASPTFTGDPKAPTPATSDNDTSVATTAYVKAQGYITSSALSPYAPLASPALTGTPTAPTPATGNNSTTIATTAFVKAQDYATNTALLAKENIITPGTTAQYWRGDKTWQTLPPSVDAYTKSESDTRFVDVTGDTMTGPLTISNGYMLVQRPADNPVLWMDYNAGYGAQVSITADAQNRWQQSFTDGSLQFKRYPANVAALTIQRSDGEVTVEHDPTVPLGVATKQYVDNMTPAPPDLSGYYTKPEADAKFVELAGDTMTGNLTIAPASGTASLSINKPDDATTNAVLYSQAGGVARWAFNLGSDGPSNFALTAFNNSGAFVGNAILGDRTTALCTVVGDPTAALGIATKQYVDNKPAGPSLATIADSAPSSPVHGQLWWSSWDGNLYIYYNDGSSSQWVQINTVGV